MFFLFVCFFFVFLDRTSTEKLFWLCKAELVLNSVRTAGMRYSDLVERQYVCPAHD